MNPHPHHSAFQSASSAVEMVDELLQDTCVELYGRSLDDEQRRRTLSSLLRAKQMLLSINVLAESKSYEDAWILTRALTELSINTSYLCLASLQEQQRWLKYDDWTFSDWVDKLGLDQHLTSEAHQQQIGQVRQARKDLTNSDLYQGSKRGGWSEKTLPDRAALIDAHLQKELDIYTLLYRWAVKRGDCFVHSSPQAMDDQQLVLEGKVYPSLARFQKTAQALAVACTSALTSASFIRVYYSMADHLLGDRIKKTLDAAFRDSALS